jgi:carbamoyltransferase
MHVLGISCYFHDAAAALVSDGLLVAAAEEERFSRIKHDFNFPDRAIRFCLAEGGLSGRDLDCVVFFEKPFVKFERILSTVVATAPRSGTVFRQAMTAWLLDKLWVKNRIRDRVGVADDRILFIPHHLSHAASAFFCSPFERAAILTVDGVGEWTTTALGVGEGSTCRLLEEVRFPHSIGLFYSAFTAFLGFEVNEGEYKVMGMAPYGTPRYADKVRSVIRQSADGAFELDLDYFTFHHSTTRTYSDKFVELFGAPRAPETPFFTKTSGYPPYFGERPGNFDSLEAANQHYADIAASVQVVTEELVLQLAHNASVIHDAVVASGLPAVTTGSEEQLIDRVTDLLARDSVVGWFQGRFEWGPRSLGNRSILASPRRADMKDIVNTKIKFREPYRPFAPSVPIEHASRYFDLATPEAHLPARFMLLVAPVRDEAKALIPAVTHVDGSARLQVVDRRSNPRYHQLIESFGAATGVPVLLNTSFNLRGEPIVNTPQEALSTFQRSGMDALVLGETIVFKHKEEPA